ncbi:hypothetical protein HYT84_00970, partial [Candidatus Micrarchaeota archaeon]|nr:hypothetical protein [Candidatus Micrarchaeota archaeon]
MVELKKIKIKKQLYKFEVRKKFQYVKRFKIKEKRPIDTIKETFKTMFRRKPEEKLGRSGLIAKQPKNNKTIL